MGSSDLENFLKLIENHGLSLVISIFVILFVYKYGNYALKQSEKKNDELIGSIKDMQGYIRDLKLSMNSVEKAIINRYSCGQSLEIIAKQRVKLILLNFKYKVIMIIWRNNIKKNIKVIKEELKSYSSKTSNATKETLRGIVEEEDIDKINDITKDTLKELNEAVNAILDDLANENKDYKAEDRDLIIRNLEAHFSEVISNTINSIEELKL